MKKIIICLIFLVGCHEPKKKIELSEPPDEIDVLTDNFPDRDGLPGTDKEFPITEYDESCKYAFCDDNKAIVAVNNGYGGVDTDGDGHFELVRKVFIDGKIGKWIFCQPSKKIDWHLMQAVNANERLNK